MKVILLVGVVILAFFFAQVAAWERTYGTPGWEWAHCVATTEDGGYLVCGMRDIGPCGMTGAWTFKLNSLGEIEWDHIIGGSDSKSMMSILATPDSGYIGVGAINPPTEDVHCVWIVKLDMWGDTIWTRRYGETGWSEGLNIAPALDGGYLVIGPTTALGAGYTDA